MQKNKYWLLKSIAGGTAMVFLLGAGVAVVKQPSCIAISRDGKRAFVPSGNSPIMAVVDLQTLQVTATLYPGGNGKSWIST